MRRSFLYLMGSLVIIALPILGGQKKTIDLPDDNPVAKLKPGPGVRTVVNNCAICHSTDYIVRQPKFNELQWQAEVEKMKKLFGAPTSESDAKVIAKYIASHYGVTGNKEKK
ncbi:MAG: cytochrome c [Terriglobia bacterium]